MLKELKFYSIRQVSEALSLNYMTIWKWIKADKLKVIRAGKSVRIAQAELERFLNEGKEKKKKQITYKEG